jgi:hypothetical protein
VNRSWPIDLNLPTQADLEIVTAKMCSSRNARSVRYAFSDNSNLLFMDKRDILLNQIQACEKLLEYAVEEKDIEAVAKEIDELKSALDLLH